MFLVAIICLIATGLCWILYGVVISKASTGGASVNQIIGRAALFSWLLALGIVAVQTHGRFDSLGHVRLGLTLFIGGFCNYYEMALMKSAMARGPNGAVWSINQSALVWPFLMGVLWFGDTYTWVRGLGIALICIGFMLAGFEKKTAAPSHDSAGDKNAAENDSVQTEPADVPKPLYRRLTWLWFTIAAFLLTGIQQSIYALPTYFKSWGVTDDFSKNVFILFGTYVATRFHALFLRKTERREPTRWKFVIPLVLSNVFSLSLLLLPAMAFLRGYNATCIAWPVTVSTCIAGFSLYTFIVVREPVTFLAVSSTLSCIAGIICLAV